MMGTEETDAANDAIRRMESEAEEAYRQQALDYSQGYKANKVKEDDDHMRHSSQPFFNQASKLMESLLASASQPDAAPKNDKTDGTAEANQSTDKASAKTAKKVKQKEVAANTSKGAMDDSDEEEETTQLLQSEFASVAATAGKPIVDTNTEAAKPKMETEDNDNDSDIDDLAQAIVTKKKKKKKSKK